MHRSVRLYSSSKKCRCTLQLLPVSLRIALTRFWVLCCRRIGRLLQEITLPPIITLEQLARFFLLCSMLLLCYIACDLCMGTEHVYNF